MQASVRVVRMLIDRPLSCLARGPLIVELFGHLGPALVNTPHTSLHIRKALPLHFELLDQSLTLIPQAPHLRRELADLIGDGPHSRDRPIQIISNICLVGVLYLAICALRRITGLRRSRRDMREPRVEFPADVPQARDDRRGGSTNNGNYRRDDRGDDLRVGNDVNHRQTQCRCLSAHSETDLQASPPPPSQGATPR